MSNVYFMLSLKVGTHAYNDHFIMHTALDMFNTITQLVHKDAGSYQGKVYRWTGPEKTYPGHWWDGEGLEGGHCIDCHYVSEDTDVHLAIKELLEQVHTMYVLKEKQLEETSPSRSISEKYDDSISFLREIANLVPDEVGKVRTLAGTYSLMKLHSVAGLRNYTRDLQKTTLTT